MDVEADLKPLPLEACGLWLSSLLAIFGGWSWLLSSGLFSLALTPASAGYILLAALSVIVQISSNYAAAAARRARAFKLEGSYRWSVKLMVAGGAYNAFSVHHAWGATGLVAPMFPLTAETLAANAPLLALSLVLAFFEPSLYWIDEALKAEAAQRRAAADAAEAAERHKRLLEMERQRQAPKPANDAIIAARPAPKPVRKTLARVAAGVGAAASLAAAQPALADAPPPAPRVSQVHAGDDARVAQACRLRDRGMTRLEVASAMQCSESTITRLWRRANAGTALAAKAA